MATAIAECLSVHLQSSTPDYGAKNFSNNAPSWDTLQHMVDDRARELDWQQPDLEEVCEFLPVAKGGHMHVSYMCCIYGRLQRQDFCPVIGESVTFR